MGGRKFCFLLLFQPQNFINFSSQKLTYAEQVTIQSLIIQIYPPTLFQRKFIVFIKITRNKQKWSTSKFLFLLRANLPCLVFHRKFSTINKNRLMEVSHFETNSKSSDQFQFQFHRLFNLSHLPINNASIFPFQKESNQCENYNLFALLNSIGFEFFFPFRFAVKNRKLQRIVSISKRL